ncbi:hypothetical protein J008_06999 [Cryptococcus neoformans]|uniref:Complex I-B15 n=2 Tax=Cryptococcus neoformans TaxID=5207 RepID=A0A854QF26_CRYNE|nr:hypothetical protein CNAG_05578 [Cryptococcus neoformans var. grubii H99]AUB29231.1 hypothetical protein CKF44_05578 [Cryptococcus neoformans var. grubii]OWT35400.1 hypothetical protein C362_06969 [Cryptococcus neoformans var. grubii Bt1]OWZ25950.1 hypothetical protein C347_06919 [Cryptococcus neoformans var. grubii AD2-60a]OWZ26079.1 hypothetical protein C353_07030 [Cryptococcus neoformans var. grubii AD1-83a]OWZ26545.1 hypothetical protein C356_06950 [Cryptococcus neoformans var. grubii c|eukprot:XP_012053661.1 hypothetical protein CNAG_05578 [Cryptococcus neoformans var. grubii H99]
MAGGHGHFEPVKLDPAIERWSQMRENVYQHFRFTPQKTRQVFTYALLLPALVAGISWAYDKKYDWAGKQKGSSLLANTPAKPLPKSDEE